jgi:hypothetical protein
MHRRATQAAVAAGSALALLAACGTAKIASNDSSAPPTTEFSHAIHALSAGSALTTTLSLDATGADITRLAAQGGSSSGLTAAQAGAIAGAHVVFEVVAPKGKTVGQVTASPGAASMSVTAGTGSSTYLSIRSVTGTIYLQVDLKGILALAGASSQYKTLQARVATFPAFVKALVAGKWVSLSLATVKSLESFAEGAAHAKLPTAAQSRKLSSRVVAAVLGDLSATRASTGITDHLVVTGNLRTIAHDVLSAIASAIPAAASLGKFAGNSVPSQPIRFDALVTGGALSKLSLDAGQFSRTLHFTLPIVARFVRSGAAISAPAGATPIDLGQLGSLIGAVDSSGSSSSGSGTVAPSPVVSGSP